jgi:hypothetical protein
MIIENYTIYDNFTQIVEHYLDNFTEYLVDNKYCYNCIYGSIEFYKSVNNNKIIVHEINVLEQYRRNGLCCNFIKFVIDKIEGTKKIFIIQSVMSKILYEYLLRFNYNKYKFILKKEGFVIKKCITYK